MYQVVPMFNGFVVANVSKAEFVFGPFESLNDAQLVADMFQANRIQLNEGEWHVEEGLEDTDTLYQHTGERTL